MKKTIVVLLFLLSGPGAFAQVAAPTRKAVRPNKTALVLPAASPATINPAAAQRLDQLLAEYTADTGTRGPLAQIMPDGSAVYRPDKHVPGAVALVLRDGKVVYRRAFGVANIPNQTPLRTDAIFRIASQTKALTSVGLMMLFDEGKFQLDDPIAKYLPAFAKPQVLATFNPKDSTYTTVPANGPVTIRQLFTHTSGISYPVIGDREATAIYAKANIPSGIGTPSGTLAPSMDALAKLPLLHQPGAKFTYGLSVDVLGRLIEVLAGQPLDQFLRQRLFEPLGMKDTYFYLPADKQARLVELYTEDARKQTVPMLPQGRMVPDYPKAKGTYFSGGAGLSSTIDDYATFLQMMLNSGTYQGRQFLKPATVALITQNQMGAVSQGGNKFGLGFSIITPENARVPGPSAGSYEWGGIFGTTYWVDPQQKLVGLIYTQKYPNSTSRDLAGKFKAAVYESFVPDQKAPAAPATPAASGTR